MAMKIESYNASYPAAFYEIGTVYSFYGNTRSSGIPAKEEYISHYASVLKSLESDNDSKGIRPVKSRDSVKTARNNGRLTRYYAVVVSKSATSIEIMFVNDDNGRESYLTRKYAVGKSCTTDGKELMAPRTKTNVNGLRGAIQKTGGITRVQNNSDIGKVGGITRAGQTSMATASVGGITRMKSQSTGDAKIPASTNPVVPRVGGITRMKK